MAETLVIVLPATTNDVVTRGLIHLTKAIDHSGVAAAHQGLLGGQWGDGANYENDVFMMHPYCWCEKPDCPWCAHCECPESAFHYFIAEREVAYDEYRAEYDRTGNTLRSESQDKLCCYCRGEFGNAPNFRHKVTGYEVRTYRYWGRDMEVTNPNGARFSRVFKECLASLETSSPYPPTPTSSVSK